MDCVIGSKNIIRWVLDLPNGAQNWLLVKKPQVSVVLRLTYKRWRFMKKSFEIILIASTARAIQQPALEIWLGKDANALAAQKALYHRARCNAAARRGEYSPGI